MMAAIRIAVYSARATRRCPDRDGFGTPSAWALVGRGCPPKMSSAARSAQSPASRPGDGWLAPMTGISDLPFRRAAARLGAAYVATEMVACAELARGRPDVERRVLAVARWPAADGGPTGRPRDPVCSPAYQNLWWRRLRHRLQHGCPARGDRRGLWLGPDERSARSWPRLIEAALGRRAGQVKMRPAGTTVAPQRARHRRAQRRAPGVSALTYTRPHPSVLQGPRRLGRAGGEGRRLDPRDLSTAMITDFSRRRAGRSPRQAPTG